MRKLEQKFLEMEELPEDPLHPIYYHVFASTLPYEFHYRIVPEGKYLLDWRPGALYPNLGLFSHIFGDFTNNAFIL